MSAVRGTDTKPELTVRRVLRDLEVGGQPIHRLCLYRIMS